MESVEGEESRDLNALSNSPHPDSLAQPALAHVKHFDPVSQSGVVIEPSLLIGGGFRFDSLRPELERSGAISMSDHGL